MPSSDPRSDRSATRPTLVLGALVLVGVVALALIVAALSWGGDGPAPTPTPGTSSSATSAPVSPDPQVSAVASPTEAPPSASHPGPTDDVPLAPEPTAAPAVDPILAGMLQAEDLPGLTDPLGVQEGSDYDIDDAAFDAQGGIRITSRVWRAIDGTGPTTVFDFRMQLPSDEAAARYLTEGEAVLSERETTGQAPVPSPRVIGTDGRVYGLEATGTDGPVLLRTYLFRVGPVAAKVVVGGPDVQAAEADAIAQAAARRMEAAGTPAPGSPRPAATPTPAPTATTALPTGDLSGLLLAHVPEPLAAGCVRDDQRLWEGEVATLVCTDVDQGVTVTYSGFVDIETLRAAYEDSLASIGITQVAASCDLGTYVGPYLVEGEEVGQVTCWSEPGGRAIMWSDERLAILSVAASPALDPAGLYLWWLVAGPIL